MKKTISIILAAMLTLGLVGCGKDSTVSNKAESSKVVEESKDINKEDEAKKKEEESKENKEASTKAKEEEKSKETSKSSTTSSQGILTKEFKDVSSMEITYNGSTKKYTVEKDKDYIKKVYDSIMSTKTTVRNDRDESDHKFTVNIVYSSGTKDVIQSTETGQFISRVFDSNKSRVCGTNNTLFNLVKEGFK